MPMIRFLALLTGAFALVAHLPSAAAQDGGAALAPGGTLRAAINFGNPVLAQKDPATGAPGGVSVALAKELGRRLGVPVTLVSFDEAGKVAAAVKQNAWDIAFLAIDPVRATGIDFTAPYVIIEGAYLVPATSPLNAVAEVDHDGIGIGVAEGSAYDLFLTRTIKQARLVREANLAATLDDLRDGRIGVVAGVRQPLEAYQADHPAVRVMPGRFMVIEQAMAMPKGHEAGLRYLRNFVEDMKASGFVADALQASHQTAAAIAPPAPRP